MSEILNGIKTVLEYLNEYWLVIVIIIALAIQLTRNIKSYFSKSKTEQIDIAKQQINQIILKLVSDAEEEYSSLEKAGQIKRSQVIEKIYNQFPILSKVVSQEEIIEYIDNAIDVALDTLKNIETINSKDGE